MPWIQSRVSFQVFKDIGNAKNWHQVENKEYVLKWNCVETASNKPSFYDELMPQIQSDPVLQKTLNTHLLKSFKQLVVAGQYKSFLKSTKEKEEIILTPEFKLQESQFCNVQPQNVSNQQNIYMSMGHLLVQGKACDVDTWIPVDIPCLHVKLHFPQQAVFLTMWSQDAQNTYIQNLRICLFNLIDVLIARTI